MGNNSAKKTNNVAKIELANSTDWSKKRRNVKVGFSDDILRGNIIYQFQSKLVRIYICSACLGIQYLKKTSFSLNNSSLF